MSKRKQQPENKSLKVLSPNTDPIDDTKCIFLAGPIVNAPDWQKEAIAIFDRLFKDQNVSDKVIIANPRVNIRENHHTQVKWESEWLKHADVIMFWLACGVPREIDEFDLDLNRPYGQTTRFELGEWLMKDPSKVVLGIEKGFPGETYIRTRQGFDHFGIDKIYSTLYHTCLAVDEMLVW